MRNEVKSARSRLILVRHAHTGMAGRFCGHSDPPLSVEGVLQLPDLTEKLGGYAISHVFSSDLERTRQTAQAIAGPRNLPIRFLPTLRELAFGRWEGKNWDEVMEQDPECAQRWLDRYPFVPAPGGEVFEDFRKRIQDAMNGIAEDIQGSCAVVVTHAGVIRTFLETVARSNGYPGDFAQCDYASCWEVTREQGRWTFVNELTQESACQAMGTRPMSDGGHIF
jgi:alpha-ribazole phosphatase/probable phosphoglycerate mutase